MVVVGAVVVVARVVVVVVATVVVVACVVGGRVVGGAVVVAAVGGGAVGGGVGAGAVFVRRVVAGRVVGGAVVVVGASVVSGATNGSGAVVLVAVVVVASAPPDRSSVVVGDAIWPAPSASTRTGLGSCVAAIVSAMPTQVTVLATPAMRRSARAGCGRRRRRDPGARDEAIVVNNGGLARELEQIPDGPAGPASTLGRPLRAVQREGFRCPQRSSSARSGATKEKES